MKYAFRSWLAIALACFLSNALLAQEVPTFKGADARTPEATFTVTTSHYAKDIKVGDEVTLCFKGKVLVDGWHLYSARTDGAIGYNPTSLFLFEEDTKGAELSGKMSENKKPREVDDEIMGLIRDFKEKEVTFCQKIKITSTDVAIEGELSAQTCVDPDKGGMCKFLQLPFTWKFTAQPAEAGVTGTPADPVTPNTNIVPETNPATQTNSDESTTNTTAGPCDTIVKYEPCPCGTGSGETTFSDVDLGKAAAVDIAFRDRPYGADEKGTGCNPTDIWSIFLIAFGAGLIALFTPCVFPMIPMTVSYFVKQNDGAGNARARGIRNGFSYSLSIIGIYTGLGVGLTLLFGPTALYQLASNPWANLVFFAIFVLFSLSFFGLFELTLPSSFTSKINSKAGATGGFIGIFFMALTLVLVSFSCTGPILGSLLVGVASSECFYAPVAGFLGFGLAFGIPFGLLALFPSALKSLPSSGGWLNSVKVVLGFLELALCLKFLSNADLILHWHFLNREVYIGIWIVIFFLLGVYLLGKIRLPHDDVVERVSVFRLMLAIFSFSFVMYLFPGLHGTSLHLMEGFLPPFNDNIGVKLLPGQVAGIDTPNDNIAKLKGRKLVDKLGEHESTGFNMLFDLQQGLYYAQEVNMPVLIDFTGHSCANCRNMENSVWIADRVRRVLTNEVVMVALFADEKARLETPVVLEDGTKLRRVSDWVQHYQATNFGVVSQPYYVMMDPYTQEVLTDPIGYSSEEEFYQMLQNGLKAFQKKYKTQPSEQ